MKGSIATILALAATAGVAWAGDDAISQRRALMKANGEASKPVVAIMKGAPFDLSVVQKALNAYADSAGKMPALFPPESKSGDTNALPAIWDSKADFDARFAKFGVDSKAALAAIVDQASFQATMPGVFKNCSGCHETYRAKTN